MAEPAHAHEVAEGIGLRWNTRRRLRTMGGAAGIVAHHRRATPASHRHRHRTSDGSERVTDALRTVIVDDEILARARLRRLLEREPDIAIVAECASGRSAIDAITELQPDLVWLDVQMPEIDGFGVVRGLSADHPPYLVFVTAFDEHAVRAFEVRAVDYLLKPIDAERVQEAVARVRDARRVATAAERYALLRQVIDDLATVNGPLASWCATRDARGP